MRTANYFRVQHLLLLLIFNSFLTSFCWSQHDSALSCGTFIRSANSRPHTTQGNVDVIDQFGNTYSKQDLIIPGATFAKTSRGSGSCTLDHFRLWFSGFTPTEEFTICKVFQDMENFISTCPDGSPPLIAISKTAFGVGNDLPPGAGGVGIVYFLEECGITNTLTFQVMSSDLNWPEEAATAELYINSALQWHTLDEDPTMAPGSYDLYTTALHELLHILGFASRIGNNPQGTNPTSFSSWDALIVAGANQTPVLIDALSTQSGCCDLKMFNPVFGPMIGGFPSGLFQYCTTQLNLGASNAWINNHLYTLGDYSEGAVNNYFSHLSLCGIPGPEYVMYSDLPPQVKRRNMRPEESAALAELGYCGPYLAPCNVIANDDYISMTIGDPYQNIPFNNFIPFINNDQHTANYQITIDENCSTAFTYGYADIWGINNGSLHLDAMQQAIPGIYTICYTLTDCMGACDDGIIYFEILPFYDPLPPCPPAACAMGQNLYCHGDFEDMLPLVYAAQGQIGIPDCNIGSSVDVLYQTNTGDIRLHLAWFEYITVPLSSPVPPGCQISISFDASSRDQVKDALVDVLAGHDLPCESGSPSNCESPGTYSCLENDIDIELNELSLSGGQLPCSDPIFANDFPGCTGMNFFYTHNNLILGHHGPFTHTNTTNESWNYVVISNKNPESVIIHFDNLVITCDCPSNNCVCLRPIGTAPTEACQGEILEIPVEICLKGLTGTSDITVQPIIPDLPGVYIVPGSDFDGPLTINDLAAGACNSYVLEVYIGYTVPVNEILTFNFDITATNATSCLDTECVDGFEVTVVNCDPSTRCDDVPWELVCYDGFFCIADPTNSGPVYIYWLSPDFTNPSLPCQSLQGLYEGQLLHFLLFVYDGGVYQYYCEYAISLDCYIRPERGHIAVKNANELITPAGFIPPIIIPNPTSDQFVFNIDSEMDDFYSFELRDISGRLFRNEKHNVAQGNNRLLFDVRNLDGGVYFLYWHSQESNQSGMSKLLIQKE